MCHVKRKRKDAVELYMIRTDNLAPPFPIRQTFLL
jgi:hypothetical protein